MALPEYAKFLANIRGPIGPKGRPGTFDDATAEPVPFDTVDIKPTIFGDDGEFIHFKLPRGLPGLNAVPTDTALATYFAAGDTATRASTDALYPLFRLWNGTTYPARVPGAMNIFFGPVHPGLLMDTAADYWANPAATTLAQVVAAFLDSSSTLVQAAETRAKQLVEATRFAPIDNRPPTFTNLSPTVNSTASAPAWSFADGVTSVVGALVAVPRGWYKVAFSVLTSTPVAAPSGGVRWNLRAAVVDIDGATNAAGSVFNVTAGMTAQNRLISATPTGDFALDGTKENLIRLSIARLGGDGEDTFTNPALMLGMRMERR